MSEDETWCKYCKAIGDMTCMKIIEGNGESGMCTRDLGHDGPCVACGMTNHDLTGVMEKEGDEDE